jgi:hypothetical protein
MAATSGSNTFSSKTIHPSLGWVLFVLVSRPTMRLLGGMCRIVQILYLHLFTTEAETFGCSRRAVAGAGQWMPKEKQP